MEGGDVGVSHGSNNRDSEPLACKNIASGVYTANVTVQGAHEGSIRPLSSSHAELHYFSPISDGFESGCIRRDQCREIEHIENWSF